MKVTWLPDIESRPRHVAVGEFDGVHLGHREVIAGADTVLTFEPHPRAVVAPDAAPKLLTSLDIKTDLIAGLGVRELVVIPFDRSFASQGPQEFIDSVLVEQLRAERVSVGENFRFGHKAKGDADLLRGQDAFEARVVRNDVGGGEAELAATLVAGHDLALEHVRRPQAAHRLLDVAGGDQRPDARRGDGLAVDLDERDDPRLERVLAAQQVGVALGLVAEAEVLPHRHPLRP